MSSEPKELIIREKTKLTLKYLENEEIEQARQVILNHKEILNYNFGLINFVPLIPRIRFSKIIPKSNDALKMVIDTGFQIFSKEDNINELLFFAAAKCDIRTLNYCLTKIAERGLGGINQIREGDTALMFLIKFGNIADENFPECVKILIKAGIDVNRNDYFAHNPIVFLAKLYERYVNKTQKDEKIIRNLKMSIQMLLDTKMIDLDAGKVADTNQTIKSLLEELKVFNLNYSTKENVEESETDKLFKFLINGDQTSFIKSRSALQLLDADDGNNTFLQLCCEKNLKEVAMFLISKGANFTKTTERNSKTPLELAARRNHPEIFDALLKTNKIYIDEELFKTFLQNRPKHIKAKYFDEILKYKHLDVNIRSNNGNTPLHYAIIFSNREAINVLLKRGASLTVENDNKKTPLDYITAEDLGNYLDKCILPDNYNEISSGKYEVALNYRSLIEFKGTHVQSELTIIDKICDSPKLCYLITHPLLSSFLDVKWKLVETLFQKLLTFNVIFYFISIFSFININSLNFMGTILAMIYSLKIYFFPFQWKNNKYHFAVEITIAGILFISSVFISNNNVKYQLGIIATAFMAFSLHLFCRFSPKFAQFHAVLIKILSHIFSYLSYILVLSLFFGAASYIVFLLKYENEANVGNDYLINIFNNVRVLLPQFYLLCAFGVFVSVIIVITLMNSLANLQEHAEKIGDNFQLFGHKNILIFLKSVEEFYVNKKGIGNPFIFEERYLKNESENAKLNASNIKKKAKNANKNKNNFLINFYINTNTFSFEKLLSVKLGDVTVKKIKKIIQR